jgi:hypothetical protein
MDADGRSRRTVSYVFSAAGYGSDSRKEMLRASFLG